MLEGVGGYFGKLASVFFIVSCFSYDIATCQLLVKFSKAIIDI
jgi:hypothetical protein